jgi:uncharacterized protein (PEP-CTERM system associated)
MPQQQYPILSVASLRNVPRVVGLSAVIFTLAQVPVWAQYSTGGGATPATGASGFHIQPSISISEVFSDNVSLAAAGSARSEWTTRVRPSVTITEFGPRLRFDATYSPELLFRANQGTTDINHFLNANGNTELIQRLLYVDVRASITQQNVSLLGPQADSNLNTTTNRTSVKTYSISPYLRHSFGYDATGELRLTHDSVHYGSNSANASATTSDRVSALLSSGPSFQLFTWGLSYSKSHTDYAQSGQKIDAENASATGGRLIVPELRLNATVGYEDSGYPTTNGRIVKGTYWSVGPTWTPTPRTNISATLGRRYFGPSKSLHLDHRSRLTVWELDYSENVSNTRSSATATVATPEATLLDALFQSIEPDPVKRQPLVQQRLAELGFSLSQPVNFLTDTLFLEKRWRAALGIQGVRNTVLTSFFSSNREALTVGGPASGDFNTSQGVKQTGASVTWTSRVTETLAPNLSLGVTRNAFGATSSADRLSYLRFNVTRQFSPKLNGSFSLSRLKNDSNRAGGTSYTENSVSATLGLKF